MNNTYQIIAIIVKTIIIVCSTALFIVVAAILLLSLIQSHSSMFDYARGMIFIDGGLPWASTVGTGLFIKRKKYILSVGLYIGIIGYQPILFAAAAHNVDVTY
jgi:hypothetical protein